jgi:hypothetical protein
VGWSVLVQGVASDAPESLDDISWAARGALPRPLAPCVKSHRLASARAKSLAAGSDWTAEHTRPRTSRTRLGRGRTRGVPPLGASQQRPVSGQRWGSVHETTCLAC